MFVVLAWLVLAVAGGCGGSGGGGGRDAGGSGVDGGGDAGGVCVGDADCDDGVFCNGAERCGSGTCVAGVPPECDDRVACTDDACDEATRACTNLPADADEDGHGDADCGGDDCDDDDPDVNPGAAESCDAEDVDEDCDPGTFGDRDLDADGAIDATCCNRLASGDRMCGGDCDDTRAGVSPTGTETCNGYDDDCDGFVDDGVRLTFYRDVDGDGFGVADMTVEDCGAPSGYALTPGDCNDAARGVNPGVPDGPPGACNMIDDDCSGGVDEGCACISPDSRMCGAMAPGGGWLTVGACRPGTESCIGGAWGTCVGAVTPSTEVCSGTVDESCDGEVNEYCPCDGLTTGSMTLMPGLRTGYRTFGGLRFHFITGDVASGPRPAYAEIEVRCDTGTNQLIRRFRRDVGDFELIYHANTFDNYEIVVRVDYGHPDGATIYVQISRP